MKQWHCLAHHVRTHQRTVGVVVLEERNQACRNRSNLHWRHVHKLNLVGSNHREVGIETRLNLGADKRTVVVERSVALCNNLAFLSLGSQINNIVVLEVDNAVCHLTVRSLDKAKLINLCINAKRRNQADVRTFRGFNRTKTSVVSVVNVAHLETGTVTRQTARTKGTQTALVSDFGKRVGLVHELRQRISTKEGVDNRRNSLCINQVGRCEHFVVTHIHAFTNGASHTCQAHAKLIVELFANSAHTTVAQVVDIVDVGLAVNQADEILDNLNDIFASEHTNVVADGQAKLLVDAETADIT